MANELTVNVYGLLVNGNLREEFSPGQLQFDQSALGSHAPTIVVGTTEEVISAGDVATLGYAFFRNLDSANYVDIGPESVGAMVGFIRLKAGRVAVMPLKPGIVIRAQANTAAVKLKMLLLEE